MSTNLYNKVYTSMKEALPQFKNPEEALSFYFEGASKYLAKAEKAARENRIEDRSNLSDKALLIFSGILSHLEQSSPEEKKGLKSLIDYCYSMNELILRMNMKNDVEMANSLATEVKRMSEHWKTKSEESFLNAQKNTSTVHNGTAQESITHPVETPRNTMPTDAHAAPPYSTEPRLSTADFSA